MKYPLFSLFLKSVCLSKSTPNISNVSAFSGHFPEQCLGVVLVLVFSSSVGDDGEQRFVDVFGHVRAVAADKDVRFFAEDQVAHFLLVFGEFMLNVDFLPSRVFAAESGNEASERFVFDESVRIT